MSGASFADHLAGKGPTPKRAPTPTLELISIGDLLAEPDEAIEFVVEGLIAKASVNAISSKPKVGKSTVARHLALAVARGDDFLGRRCPDIGTVWYFALEGSRGDIRKAFRKLGATADDPVMFPFSANLTITRRAHRN